MVLRTVGARMYVEEHCLVPEREIKIEYRGVYPLKICKIARGMLLRVLETPSHWVWEREFKWDTTSDPRPFYARYYGRKYIDGKTYLAADIIAEGKQPADVKKPGNVAILISGLLITEYRLDQWWKKPPFTYIYRSFVSLYHRLVYDEMRSHYMRVADELLGRIAHEIRAAYGLV
jgi:hypothetical protein